MQIRRNSGGCVKNQEIFVSCTGEMVCRGRWGAKSGDLTSVKIFIKVHDLMTSPVGDNSLL